MAEGGQGNGGEQLFRLEWMNFNANLKPNFKYLMEEQSFMDVTIACEGETVKAHRMVLAAGSTYFKELLEQNPSKHAIIVLKDVPLKHLQVLIEFMYTGEMVYPQEDLAKLLKTARKLKVTGLQEQ